jgi:hypothetical protein
MVVEPPLPCAVEDAEPTHPKREAGRRARDSEIRRGPARLGTGAVLLLLLGKRRAHALNELLARDHAVGMQVRQAANLTCQRSRSARRRFGGSVRGARRPRCVQARSVCAAPRRHTVFRVDGPISAGQLDPVEIIFGVRDRVRAVGASRLAPCVVAAVAHPASEAMQGKTGTLEHHRQWYGAHEQPPGRPCRRT